MQGIPSGGGSDREHRSADESTPDPDDRLHEVFGAPGPAEVGERFDSGSTGRGRTHPSELPDSFEGQASRNRQGYGPLRRWTAATVTLVLVSALAFGYLSVTTGSTLAAFAAGLLVGLGTLFVGLGEMIDVLVAVH
jgi:hypothetical protein